MTPTHTDTMNLPTHQQALRAALLAAGAAITAIAASAVVNHVTQWMIAPCLP